MIDLDYISSFYRQTGKLARRTYLLMFSNILDLSLCIKL